MKNLNTLIGYEIKKLMLTKKFLIAFVLLVIFCLLAPAGIFFGDVYVDNEPVRSKYEDYLIYKEYNMALSGRAIDESLLTELVDAYSNYPTDGSIEEQRAAFDEHIRPYYEVGRMVASAFGKSASDYGFIASLTEEQIATFDDTLFQSRIKNLDGFTLNNTSVEMLTELYNDVESPMVFAHIVGYSQAMNMYSTNAVIAALFAAAFLSGLFSGEYQTRAVALQLSSKNGKHLLFLAKIITATIFCAVIVLSSALATMGIMMATYGPENPDASIQNTISYLPYNFNLIQAVLIDFVVVFFVFLSFASFVILISAWVSSPIIPLSIAGMFLIVPLFINIPVINTPLFNAINLLPTKNFEMFNILSEIPYELPWVSIPSFIFMPIFHLVTAVLLTFVAYRVYRKHQVT